MKIKTDKIRLLVKASLENPIHENFHFSRWNSGIYPGKGKIKNCGTMGCLLGEAPGLWFQFRFSDDGGITLNNHDINSYTGEREVLQFFGLSLIHFRHLFIPDSQIEALGANLGIEATKQQVCNNALKFCELAEAGKI